MPECLVGALFECGLEQDVYLTILRIYVSASMAVLYQRKYAYKAAKVVHENIQPVNIRYTPPQGLSRYPAPSCSSRYPTSLQPEVY